MQSLEAMFLALTLKNLSLPITYSAGPYLIVVDLCYKNDIRNDENSGMVYKKLSIILTYRNEPKVGNVASLSGAITKVISQSFNKNYNTTSQPNSIIYHNF